MRTLIVTLGVSAVIGLMLTSIIPTFAHIHPIVPADECANPNDGGAGNTAQPPNPAGQQFVGAGFIPNVNPSEAEGTLQGRSSAGAGVVPATDNCKEENP